MTEQHECEWGVLKISMAVCVGDDEHCREVLHHEEIESRLNEYETLVASQPSVAQHAQQSMGEATPINEKLREYETLKKATEALSAEMALDLYFHRSHKDSYGASKEALRTYANMLEGKDEKRS